MKPAVADVKAAAEVGVFSGNKDESQRRSTTTVDQGHYLGKSSEGSSASPKHSGYNLESVAVM